MSRGSLKPVSRLSAGDQVLFISNKGERTTIAVDRVLRMQGRKSKDPNKPPLRRVMIAGAEFRMRENEAFRVVQ